MSECRPYGRQCRPYSPSVPPLVASYLPSENCLKNVLLKKEGSDVSVDHAAMATMFWGGGTPVSYTGPQKQSFKLPLSHPAPHLMPFR